MLNLSYVEYIDLSSCKLGPHFPKRIQKLKNLTRLDIANTRISDTVPLEFRNTWPFQLRYLNLSSNNITAEVPNLLSNFDNRSIIDLSSNNLYGPITNVSSALTLLNLSGNKFSGGFLEFLDLSNNFLTGQVPDCLWNFRELKVLNLGHNNLYGRLPASVESLIKLEVLYLYKDAFSGELPLSLKNCTNLNFLNLGSNKFSTNVPVWIGENLSKLYVLSLRSNFFGTIPSQLCQLVNLQLLDLSRNNLYGTIPSCLNNLTTMVQEGVVTSQTVHRFAIPWYGSRTARPDTIYDEYIDRSTIEWQGNVREFSSILGDEESNVPPKVGESEDLGEDVDEFQRWFYIGGGIGLANGFSIAFGTLVLNHSVRHVFFHFLDRLKDCVYVKVMVFIAKLQRSTNV